MSALDVEMDHYARWTEETYRNIPNLLRMNHDLSGKTIHQTFLQSHQLRYFMRLCTSKTLMHVRK